MFVLIIVIILLLSASRDWEEAQEMELSEDLAEMRHQELMDLERDLHNDLKKDLAKIEHNQKVKNSSNKNFVQCKRYLKDKAGNIIAEEILTSGPDF